MGEATQGDRSWLAKKRNRPAEGESEAVATHYRVILMERDMEEILHSQDTFLRRLGKTSASPPGANEKGTDISKAYQQQVRAARSWCGWPQNRALVVNYRTLVEHPDEVLPDLADFLVTPEKAAAMAACIAPDLYRARKTVAKGQS